jgi:hypothetical protein
VSDLFQSLADSLPSHLRKEVERELINGWNVAKVKDAISSKQQAVFNNQNAARSIDGLGELKARIPPNSFHYWGQRLGYECWSDKQFLNDFIKHNPEVAIRNRVKRTVVNGAVFTASGHLVP